MRVEELWRYPVKSMLGERLDQVEVSATGMVGDRAWSVLDAASQRTLTGRREPLLLQASARVDGSGVVISLPDGTETNDDAALSNWLGRDVQLVAAQPELVGTYEIQLDFETEVGEWFEWQGPEGSFHDSTKSRLSLASVASYGDWDAQRFRTNILLGDCAARAEDALVGSVVHAGNSVKLNVTKQIDRCIMVTRPQAGGVERDLDVLRTINRDHGTFLAVGALVEQPGPIAVGDRIETATA